MLRDLHISNLAVLEEAAIELGAGFNVLSGETGAGKSIVVDSLALLSGVRASGEAIRTGADTLSVTGVFEPSGEGWRRVLEGAGLDSGEGMVVIRREVSRQGPNRVFVNDRPATLRLVADLAPHLLRIHGQREELGLVEPELQRTWLDRCGGEEAEGLLAGVATAHADWKAVADRLERLTGDERARHERIDFLRFQIAEIDDAAPELGEEEALRRERQTLRHADTIRNALAAVCEELFDRDGAAYEQLASAHHKLVEIAPWDPASEEWGQEIEGLNIRLGELDAAIHRRLDEVEADPRRLDEVESRLSVLERLFRKHGDGTEALLDRRRELGEELEELSGDASSLEALRQEHEATLAAYLRTAEALSRARRGWAEILAERVQGDLAELALARARFEVRLERRRRQDSPLRHGGEGIEFGPLGIDQVSYAFTPNPGEELRPLAKVASGGELSRLYLAVQLAARNKGGTTTLVFDEVDAGISGAEAAVLGAKLRRLGRGAQVLAVTHLPQVASQADLHFKVSKGVRDGRTHTAVTRLGDDGRVEEVARMLAGSEVTELSLSHARELIHGDSTPADPPLDSPPELSAATSPKVQGGRPRGRGGREDSAA